MHPEAREAEAKEASRRTAVRRTRAERTPLPTVVRRTSTRRRMPAVRSTAQATGLPSRMASSRFGNSTRVPGRCGGNSRQKVTALEATSTGCSSPASASTAGKSRAASHRETRTSLRAARICPARVTRATTPPGKR